MRCLLKIVKAMGIYIFCSFLFNSLFSWIFFELMVNEEMQYSYWKVFLYFISDNVNRLGNEEIFIWQILHQFCQIICISILTGFILTYILNREPRVCWPDNLVIRHSKSGHKKLTLGIMISNKSRKTIHDAHCVVSCKYIANEETEKTTTHPDIEVQTISIENYHRFSIKLEELPVKLLQDFITQPLNESKKDSISVYISGNLTGLGNPFLLCHQYKLSEICIDDGTVKYEKEIRNPFTGEVLWTKIDWKALKACRRMGEEERQKIIDEIRTITSKT